MVQRTSIETLSECPQPWGRVDILTGGFPCQDISIANSHATGLSGRRSGLWWAMLGAVRLVRPRIIVVENVAALLGRGMGDVLGGLAAEGYDSEWDCFHAFEAGLPHPRKRIFIVAHPDSEPLAESILDQSKAELHLRTELRGDRTPEVSEHGGPTGQPPLCGMVHGFSPDLDRADYQSRIAALGNSIIPEIAEAIGHAIVRVKP